MNKIHTMIRILTVCLFIFFIFVPGHTQSADFGIWYGLNGEKSINKKIAIEMSAMIRTFNNASRIDQAFLEAGISYKFNKHLSSAASYRITDNHEDNLEYHIRHKWFADIKGSLPLGNVEFSARLRFQIMKKTFYEDAGDKIPDYHSRIRLKGVYKIPKFPVNPSISIESFCAMFENSERLIDKNRLTLGLEYKISKKHSVEAGYIFQRDFLPHVSDINIISVDYNISF